jgi:energy-converting hydrogenase Eha subunit E
MLLSPLVRFAGQASAIIGACLYVDYFDRDLTLLILISAAFILSCFLLFPLLRTVFKASEQEPKATT